MFSQAFHWSKTQKAVKHHETRWGQSCVSLMLHWEPIFINVSWVHTGSYGSFSFAGGVEDHISCQVVQLVDGLAAEIQFHAWVRETNFLEKSVGVKCSTSCLLEKLSNHALRKSLEQRHVALNFITSMFSFYVTLHLSGVGIGDGISMAIAAYGLENLCRPCPFTGNFCHGIGQHGNEEGSGQKCHASPKNPQPTFCSGVKLHCGFQGWWWQLWHRPFQTPDVLMCQRCFVQIFFSHPTTVCITSSKP